MSFGGFIRGVEGNKTAPNLAKKGTLFLSAWTTLQAEYTTALETLKSKVE